MTAGEEFICGRCPLSHRRGPIEPRYLLDLTVAFDQDVVDGAPAARFMKRLIELIESGYGLAEAQPDAPAPAASPG